MQRFRLAFSAELAGEIPERVDLWRQGSYSGCDIEVVDEAAAQWLAWVRSRFGAGGRHNIGMVADQMYKAVFFDMDATAIAEESLVEIAAAVGKRAVVEELTEKAMRGGLDFSASLKARLALLVGVRREVVLQVGSSLTINPGLKAFSEECRRRGVPVFLVSGGFTVLAATLAKAIAATAYHANELAFIDDKLTGEVVGPIVDAQAKYQFIHEQCQKYGWSLAEIAAVGDGANDIPMLKAAGAAIGYRCKPILHPLIHAYIGNGDHGFLAPLLFGRGASA